MAFLPREKASVKLRPWRSLGVVARFEGVCFLLETVGCGHGSKKKNSQSNRDQRPFLGNIHLDLLKKPKRIPKRLLRKTEHENT